MVTLAGRGGPSEEDILGEGLGGSRREPLLSKGPGSRGDEGDGDDVRGVMAAVLILTLMRVVLVRCGNNLGLGVLVSRGVGLIPVVDVWTRVAGVPLRLELLLLI